MGIYNDGNDASNVKFYHGIIVSHVNAFVEWEILLRGMLDIYSQAQTSYMHKTENEEKRIHIFYQFPPDLSNNESSIIILNSEFQNECKKCHGF